MDLKLAQHLTLHCKIALFNVFGLTDLQLLWDSEDRGSLRPWWPVKYETGFLFWLHSLWSIRDAWILRLKASLIFPRVLIVFIPYFSSKNIVIPYFLMISIVIPLFWHNFDSFHPQFFLGSKLVIPYMPSLIYHNECIRLTKAFHSSIHCRLNAKCMLLR